MSALLSSTDASVCASVVNQDAELEQKMRRVSSVLQCSLKLPVCYLSWSDLGQLPKLGTASNVGHAQTLLMATLGMPSVIACKMQGSLRQMLACRHQGSLSSILQQIQSMCLMLLPALVASSRD